MPSRLSLRSLISSTVGGTCRADAHEMILARFLQRPGRRLLGNETHLPQVTVADLGDGLQDSERCRDMAARRAGHLASFTRAREIVAPVSAPAPHDVEERLANRCGDDRSIF